MTNTGSDGASTTRQPNVIFILTDDQGYGDLACHGNPYIQTPHLDRLWAESVRFTNFHVAPTCSPTRAGLLTGHYANATGVWHTIGGRSLLRRDERTLADSFSAAGYATALFGKWHLGDAYPYRPQDRGFREVVTHGGGGIGNTPDFWGNDYVDDTYCHNGIWESYEGYCTDVWFRLATGFITRHGSNGSGMGEARDRPAQPFFCYIPTNAPHLPHVVPERYIAPYRELAERDPDAARFFNYPATDQMLRFYAMVTCIDENVGALQQRLEELGLAENTVFIFMTDNGSAGGLALDRDRFVTHGFNAGMRGNKGTPYEGGHRVPFFLRWPAGGLATGRDISTLAANVDFAPTLLDLCGVPFDPAAHHGRSLVPLLTGGGSDHGAGTDQRHASAPGAEGVIPESGWPERTLVVDSQRLLQPVPWRHSCVMRQEAGGEWRLINGSTLYDLRQDPEQRHDVAADHPDVVQHLRADYEAWWQLVSGRFDEETPIRLGDPAVGTVLLTSHDWRRDPGPERITGHDAPGDDARAVWNQAQVRQGVTLAGYWEVEVARPGRYGIELRRWPREADLALAEGIPGEPKPYNAIWDGYGGGRPLPIAHASVCIGTASLAAAVDAEDHAARFEVDVPAGPAHLETTFSLAQAEGDPQLGAYYVYVDYLR